MRFSNCILFLTLLFLIHTSLFAKYYFTTHPKFKATYTSDKSKHSTNSLGKMNHASDLMSMVNAVGAQISSKGNDRWLSAKYECDYWQAMIDDYGVAVPIGKSIASHFIRTNITLNNAYEIYFPPDSFSAVMQKVSLYERAEFRDFIKRFNEYDSLFLKIYPEKNDESIKKLVNRPTLHYIQNERQRIIQKNERIFEVKQRQDLLQLTSCNFNKAQEDVLNEYAEWKNLHEFSIENDLKHTDHYLRRQSALDDIAKNGATYHEHSYRIDEDVRNLLKNYNADPEQYAKNYGNQLQHELHQESLVILAHTNNIQRHSPLSDYKKSLVYLTEASRLYNQNGECHKSSALNDFCWSMLDYGSAIAEGIAQGLIGAVQDIIEHPVQAAACVVAGKYVFAYQLLKVTIKLADIGLAYTFDKERGSQKWDDYIKPLTNVIDSIKQKKLTLRDGIKGATAFGVGCFAQQKMLKGLGSVYKTARVKAVEFAKNNPLVHPAAYMQTPDGAVFKISHNSNIQPNINDIRNGISQESALKNLEIKRSINFREIVLPKVKSYEQARNKALELIKHADPNGSVPAIGNLGTGEGKIVGRRWNKNKISMRIDFDPIKGPHINVVDFTIGKKLKAMKIVIPFEGNESTVKSILKHLNTKANLETAKYIFEKIDNDLNLEIIKNALNKKN